MGTLLDMLSSMCYHLFEQFDAKDTPSNRTVYQAIFCVLYRHGLPVISRVVGYDNACEALDDTNHLTNHNAISMLVRGTVLCVV